MKRRPWKPAELAAVRTHYADTPTAQLAADLVRPVNQVYAKASALGLHKSDAYLASPAACRLRRGAGAGSATRFPKGHVPANKGLRRPGYSRGRGRMQETQFKKGQLSGRARELFKPIGTERISKDGYLERKINNDLPLQRRWRAVHILLWEQHNGPLPDGHALAFRNRDKTDIRRENLELVTRAEMMRRNTYHNYPKPIALAIQLRGALMRKINRIERAGRS